MGRDKSMVAELVSHATKRIIPRRYAGLQEHPARRVSQLIADEQVAAMTGGIAGDLSTTTIVETHQRCDASGCRRLTSTLSKTSKQPGQELDSSAECVGLGLFCTVE